MPFAPTTAEHVVGAVEGTVANGGHATSVLIAAFLDIPESRAAAALNLAVDLGLLAEANGTYSPTHPMARFLLTPDDHRKAAALRVVLESYQPFIVFRARLAATDSAESAAQQCQALLGLPHHREEVKDTLISLGTFAHAIVAEGGGRHRIAEQGIENVLRSLAASCSDISASEQAIRREIGLDAAGIVSHAEVIAPLADALLRGREGDGRGTVLLAGNATESYLSDLAVRLNVNIAGAHGINAKLDRFDQAGSIPQKLLAVGKYLGNVRNAADHGIDPDIGTSWAISDAAGVNYVFAACAFIAAMTRRELGHTAQI